MKRMQAGGFSTIEAIIFVVLIAGLGCGGWAVWNAHLSKKASNNKSTQTSVSNNLNTNMPPVDPYAGWKTGESDRAKFTFKYPSDWAFTSQLGSKDGVEYISVVGPRFTLSLDSYLGEIPGHNTNFACPDCVETTKSTSITVPGLGDAVIKAVTYRLDDKNGQALIAELPDATYYISSPKASNVKTTFRGISNLDSLEAYQSETASLFQANTDYSVALKILKSISY